MNLRILKEMLKEEWRMHSTLFKGRSFALFPLLIFLFAFIFSYISFNFSTLSVSILGSFFVGLSFFLGLGVGSLGFSSSDAVKNILGETNYIVYSSRTLPVSKKSLIMIFVVKDLIYYILMFLTPLSIGFLVATNFIALTKAALILPSFFAGLSLSLVLTLSSLQIPGLKIVKLKDKWFISPLADKSVKDIVRSSGGVGKILFSLVILTGFYWYFVLYFPFNVVFLNNPLLSFSVILGL
ncbi:MAG: hypothetical protein ABEI78_00120, partial [Candidatus Nanohaloarchaea archaeon]